MRERSAGRRLATDRLVDGPAPADRTGTLRILMYHSVSPRPATQAFRRYRIPPGLLDEQLSALADAGLTGVTVSHLLAAAVRGEDVGRLVALTFDDAFVDFAEHALPLLMRHSVEATLYVPTAHVGREAGWLGARHGQLQVLDWPTLRAVAEQGVEVGAHGHWHRELDAIPAAELHEEVTLSRSRIEDALGSPPLSFAYPFGYTSAAVRAAVRAAGFTSACEVGYANTPLRGLDPLALRRMLISPETRPEQLLPLLAGRPSAEAVLRRWSRPGWRAVRRARARVSRGARPASRGTGA